ncbi:CPBP family intramembrane glutamic endopeptidase [Nonomuraea zeae]|uniref:CPBP family intramembrane metalloprotease n=1 Tax=Nonomuraea zeae TaxID=1642303 RepID=A0A5S4GEG9_9ACTN|nr:type II CAAX endopeptidase family protein [Nonomuraea zeae]TMR31388.1 CPBP family intramembrane metalloprotease [Nonomuraea zeae]
MQENPGAYPPYDAPPPGYPYQPQRPSWFLPVPHGARYDHLARIPGAHPWRAIVGSLIIAVGFFAIGVVVVYAGLVLASLLGISAPMDPSGALFGDPVFGLVVVLLSIVPVLPLVFGTTALVQRRRPGTLSSVAGRLRWPWLLRCAGLAVLALVLGQGTQIVALSLSGQGGDIFGWIGWERFLPALIVLVLLVPFQAAAEEYAFRGWFLQAVGVHVRNPIWAILIGSVLFASLHGYSWVGLIDVFSFGAVMGWLAVRTGGLEAPIALHVMNNLLAFGLSAAAGQLDDALDQGKVPVPWQALTGTVVQLGVYAFGVLYLAKKRSVDTVSG